MPGLSVQLAIGRLPEDPFANVDHTLDWPLFFFCESQFLGVFFLTDRQIPCERHVSTTLNMHTKKKTGRPMSIILSLALLQCLVFSSSPHLLPPFVSLSTKSLSLLHTPTSGVWLFIFCPGVSVRSPRQLEAVQQKALSICSVNSACISSF